MKGMNYFKKQVRIEPFGGVIPLWVWDMTIYSLWFAAIGIFVAGVIFIISIL